MQESAAGIQLSRAGCGDRGGDVPGSGRLPPAVLRVHETVFLPSPDGGSQHIVEGAPTWSCLEELKGCWGVGFIRISPVHQTDNRANQLFPRGHGALCGSTPSGPVPVNTHTPAFLPVTDFGTLFHFNGSLRS